MGGHRFKVCLGNLVRSCLRIRSEKKAEVQTTIEQLPSEHKALGSEREREREFMKYKGFMSRVP